MNSNVSSNGKRCIVTNFAYGTGPYLRTTNLAIALNDEFEARGEARLNIIVPWVYGERQKRIMLRDFAIHEVKYPGEILLDKKLGAILGSIFYGDEKYEQALERWITCADTVSSNAARHLEGRLQVETLFGEKEEIGRAHIALELNRSPRLSYSVAPSYFTSFAYLEEILERALDSNGIAVKPELLRRGAALAAKFESRQKKRCLAYPGTFAYLKSNMPRYSDEITAPPLVPPPKPNNDRIEPGIFVTITGIPGLERLYEDAKRLGLKIYSNDPDAVAGSTRAVPYIIPNKNVLLHFARAGWSSIWASMISGTPLVVPQFDAEDDPEIYFNNRSVEELGLGIVYRGQPLKEIFGEAVEVRLQYRRICDEILARWGTLDGNRYAAKIFADDFLAGER